MIIVKIINQKVVQVAFTGHQKGCQQFFKPVILNNNNRKSLINKNTSYTLIQSTRKDQKITNANNQYLIPIARNISFRECNNNTTNQHKTTTTSSSSSSKVSFSSISSSSACSPIATSQAHFISATNFVDHHHPSIFVDEEQEKVNRESPLEVLKRKAKDVVGETKRINNNKSKYYGQSFNETSLATTSGNERKLVVLMSWLEAKEKHIEKYRQFYLDRGFDVLNVKTTALDLLLPTIGAKKISNDFARFMIEKQYSDVLLHGFSVGGYMFGQLLLDIDKQSIKIKEKILNSIRGIVFDSLVPFEGICIGVSNSITSNKFLVKFLEQLLKLYLYLGNNIATKYYREASDKVWSGPINCPTLFLSSKDDVISDHKIIERLQKVWSNLGIDCDRLLVDKSPHVQIFQKHHSVYVNKVESFLNKIKMNN